MIKLSSAKSYHDILSHCDKIIKWLKLSSDKSYQAMEVINIVIKVRIYKAVKRSDGWWHFACGNVYSLRMAHLRSCCIVHHEPCRSSQSTTGTERRRNASHWAFAAMEGLIVMMLMILWWGWRWWYEEKTGITDACSTTDCYPFLTIYAPKVVPDMRQIM